MGTATELEEPEPLDPTSAGRIDEGAAPSDEVLTESDTAHPSPWPMRTSPYV